MNYSRTIDTIANAITKVYKKDDSDKTFTAKVTDIIKDGSKLRILYCGSTYTVSSSIDCEVDDIVMVCAPCNNWNDLYIVQNKSKGKTLRDYLQYIELSTEDPDYEDKPIDYLKYKWATLPSGHFSCSVKCGGTYFAIIQKINNGLDGFIDVVQLLGIVTLTDGVWSN